MTTQVWRGCGIATLVALGAAGTIAWVFAPTLQPQRKASAAIPQAAAQQLLQSDRDNPSTDRATLAGPILKQHLPEADVHAATMSDRWASFATAASDSVPTGLTAANTALASPTTDTGSQIEAKKVATTRITFAVAVVPLPRPRPVKAKVADSIDPPLPRPRTAGSAPPSVFTAVTVSDDRYPEQ